MRPRVTTKLEAARKLARKIHESVSGGVAVYARLHKCGWCWDPDTADWFRDPQRQQPRRRAHDADSYNRKVVRARKAKLVAAPVASPVAAERLPLLEGKLSILQGKVAALEQLLVKAAELEQLLGKVTKLEQQLERLAAQYLELSKAVQEIGEGLWPDGRTPEKPRLPDLEDINDPIYRPSPGRNRRGVRA